MMQSLLLTKALFVETGTYGDMFFRPFTADYNLQTQNQFVELTSHQTRVSGQMLAGLAGSVVRPSAEALGKVDIPQGWGERRLYFCLEVETNTHASGKIIQFITGYTDHMGATTSGYLDPKMRLFINNTARINVMSQNTPMGAIQTYMPQDMSHVLTPPAPMAGGFQSYSGFGAPPAIDLMTPQDVMQSLMTDSFQGVDLVTNLSTGFQGNEIRKSKRGNGIATDYLARSINAINAAQLQHDALAQADLANIYSAASDTVMEGLISNDPFLSFLEERTTFATMRSVALEELFILAPNFDAVAAVSFNAHQVTKPVADRGHTEYWNASTQEAVMANILSYSVPAIMMELMLTQLRFSATNMTLDGSVQLDILNVQSFARGLDIRPYIQRFIDRFTAELMSDLTFRNAVGVNLIMDVDVLGDTRISVSFNGGPLTDFILPSFCDARFSPIVTPNGNFLKDMSFAIGTMASNVGQALHPAQTDLMNYQSSPIIMPNNWSNNNGAIQRPSGTL